MKDEHIADVILVGGGIMSATLGTLISRLEPEWSIEVHERLASVAKESSEPWNNAGTGHAALCELNYMPQNPDGTVSAAKAVFINEQFQLSRQLWSFLCTEGALPEPEHFISATPHITFVRGEANRAYLKKRFEALSVEPLFAGIQYTEDPQVVAEWAPLLMAGRSADDVCAATKMDSGTDVDFGALTRFLCADLEKRNVTVNTSSWVTKLRRDDDGLWVLSIKNAQTNTVSTKRARFVFVGAGGGALALLQKSGIDEIRGFGGFPISGQFMRTRNPELLKKHRAKVYGKAAVGAPPMSVPHLDLRVVDGKEALFFGPFAGFSPKFLKTGSLFDLPFSIRSHNIGPMLGVARKNFDLVRYLFGELLASKMKKLHALQEFFPEAVASDWDFLTAGQRVQVIKKDKDHGGVLQFGTEVIVGAQGTIAGLLGASPGASTAAAIMVDVLQKCFPERHDSWKGSLLEMMPSCASDLSLDASACVEQLSRTATVLKLAVP